MSYQMPSHSTSGALLARFGLLQSGDLDEVRAHVGRVFCEHDLRVVGPAQKLDTQLCYRRIGQLGFGRMQYGAAVDIDPGELNDFFLLQIPTRGHETIRVGSLIVESTPAMGSIVSPTLPFRMHHGEGTEKLFIRIERAAMERQFTQLYARPLRGHLEFQPQVNLHPDSGSSLRRLVDWLFSEASDGDLLEHSLIAARLQETLMTVLLDTLPHNQCAAHPADGMVVSPRFVTRAQSYIEQHAHEPLTAGDIAAHAGVSVRSLFAGFRKYRDTSPMAYLKDLRLDLARAELRASPTVRGCVTRVALQWGFSHFGQFSAAYRRRFGELPSATLNRGQPG